MEFKESKIVKICIEIHHEDQYPFEVEKMELTEPQESQLMETIKISKNNVKIVLVMDEAEQLQKALNQLIGIA